MLLGVDRLDYTKGIPERLSAFGNALERFPHLREKTSLVQIVVPSRVSLPKYRELKIEIERLVGSINGRYAQTGWVPIHYIFRSVDRAELVALYQAADIALITPLKDGMNLVAKEYCAANITEEGVLIMSEFAGAAAQMNANALLVNPYDVEEVAEAIAAACEMPRAEKRRRMRALRRQVRKFDIYWWVDSVLNAVFAHDLKAFPPVEDYVPSGNEMRMQAQNGNQVWENGMAAIQLLTTSWRVPLMPCPLVQPSAQRDPIPSRIPPLKAVSQRRKALDPMRRSHSSGTMTLRKFPEIHADRKDPTTTPARSIHPQPISGGFSR